MHEYSLARALLRQVEEIVRLEGAAAATSVSVTIGEFSGIEPDLLEMAFADTAEQSSLVKGGLLIEKVALEAQCEECSHRFAVERFHFICPWCESGNVKVVRGEEMMLERVVLEVP